MKKIISFLIRRIPKKYLIKYSVLPSKIASAVLRGNTFFCPICCKSYKKFLPYGIPPRNNALCPGCLSLERHRMLWLYFKNDSAIFNSKIKLLHLAPERCLYNKFKITKNIEYITADLESPLAKIKMDIKNIPYGDNYFDYIICFQILEHINDDLKAMHELYRVLKKGGRAFIQVPIDRSREKTFKDPSIDSPQKREKYYGQKDHVRVYGLDFPKKLEKIGFRVKTINYTKLLNQKLRIKYGLLPNDFFYVSKK